MLVNLESSVDIKLTANNIIVDGELWAHQQVFNAEQFLGLGLEQPGVSCLQPFHPTNRLIFTVHGLIYCQDN